MDLVGKMTLSELQIGQSAEILHVGGSGALRQHILDMGMIPGTVVKVVKYAPMGDPIQLLIHGYELTLRLDDARQIGVSFRESEQTSTEVEEMPRFSHEHPGYGEMGRSHSRVDEHPLSRTALLSFALVGNQNCGKTTLFNQLTGLKQHVGNFPGVTVDQKSGPVSGISHTLVTDLPGIYSLSPYTNEEIVSREFILKEKPTGIINIVDATNIERNLYLTMQLLELGIPTVLALNMMDEVRNNGGTIRINEMEKMLGIPVVPISAMRNEGVDELVKHALHVARYQEAPERQDFCSPTDHDGAVHRCLHATMHFIEDHAKKAGIPVRFAASKVIEGDAIVIQSLSLTENELQTIGHIVRQMEEERGLDAAAAMADMRYSFIHKVCAHAVVKPRESIEHRRSRHIDTVLTGKWTALPAFLCIMMAVFWFTFDVIGGNLQALLEDLTDRFIRYADATLTAWEVSPVIHGLVVDGIFTGVGTVCSFLPIIISLFFFLSMLEDSGYMARIAFVMDKLLRKLGLSGRSIVPLLIGFGCSVPSVMASRTLPSERDRKLTVMLTPFMSCTAKLPIYAFFSVAFFPENAAWIMISLYILGIVVGIIMALLMKKTVYRGEAVPFVMELPNYRIPGVKSVVHLLWDKSRDFLQRAFSVIFIATIVIWFLQSFDFRLQLVADSQHSMLARLADLITPLFSPMGYDDWRVVTSLISGFMAKESIVSTLTVLFGTTEELLQTISAVSAYALLVFCLLYTPCVAAFATIRREMGNRFAAILVVWQCVVAWLCSFIVYRLIMLFL